MKKLSFCSAVLLSILFPHCNAMEIDKNDNQPTNSCSSFLDILPKPLMAKMSKYLTEDKKLFYLNKEESSEFRKKLIDKSLQKIHYAGKNLKFSKQEHNLVSAQPIATHLHIATHSHIGSTQFYDTKTGQRRDTQNGKIKRINLDSTGHLSCSIDQASQLITIHSALAPEESNNLKLPLEDAMEINRFDYILLTKEDEDVYCLWDAINGERIAEFDQIVHVEDHIFNAIFPTYTFINDFFVFLAKDNLIHIYDLEAKKELETEQLFKKFEIMHNHIELTEKGTKQIFLFNTQSKQFQPKEDIIKNLKKKKLQILECSTDDNFVLTREAYIKEISATWRAIITKQKLFNLTTGQPVCKLPKSATLKFTDNGKFVVADNRKIYDTQTGELIYKLRKSKQLLGINEDTNSIIVYTKKGFIAEQKIRSYSNLSNQQRYALAKKIQSITKENPCPKSFWEKTQQLFRLTSQPVKSEPEELTPQEIALLGTLPENIKEVLDSYQS